MGFRIQRKQGSKDPVMELFRQEEGQQEAAVPSQKPKRDENPLIEGGMQQLRPRPVLAAAKVGEAKVKFGLNPG
jgi:hypothetical protein